MTDTELLTLVKMDLQIVNTLNDAYLNHLVAVSKVEIGRKGITLNLDDIDDCHLIVMYAAYLYKKRTESQIGEPRMLQFAIHNRLLDEKTEVLT